MDPLRACRVLDMAAATQRKGEGAGCAAGAEGRSAAGAKRDSLDLGAADRVEHHYFSTAGLLHHDMLGRCGNLAGAAVG